MKFFPVVYIFVIKFAIATKMKILISFVLLYATEKWLVDIFANNYAMEKMNVVSMNAR